MPDLNDDCKCMGKMKTNGIYWNMKYPYAVIFATSEISANEGEPFVSVGLLQGLEMCHFSAFGALLYFVGVASWQK